MGPVIFISATITVTCDNHMELYIDGELKATHDDWGQATTVEMGASPSVIAIRCNDLHVVGGILAHMSNGQGTDSTWKCRNGHQDDWNQPGFDDSQWLDAYQIVQYPSGIWGRIGGGMSGNPYWIWTAGWQGQDTDVHCRKTLAGKLTML